MSDIISMVERGNKRWAVPPTKRASWPSVKSQIRVDDLDRAAQRAKLLTELGALPDKNGNFDLNLEEENKILLRSAGEHEFVLNKFSRLSNILLFRLQHFLMKAEEEITYSNPLDSNEIRDIGKTLVLYYNIIKATQDMSTVKRPGVEVTRKLGGDLARSLYEPRYWDSPDSLNLIDLSNEDSTEFPDKVRLFLEKQVPTSLLDSTGKEYRNIQKRKKDVEMKAGTAEIIQALELQPFHVSPVTDSLARLIIAIVGGAFLLVPMAVMTFLPASKVWPLIVTAIFVLLFATVVAVATKATNQEMLGATAAYAAVLVVFVGTG